MQEGVLVLFTAWPQPFVLLATVAACSAHSHLLLLIFQFRCIATASCFSPAPPPPDLIAVMLGLGTSTDIIQLCVMAMALGREEPEELALRVNMRHLWLRDTIEGGLFINLCAPRASRATSRSAWLDVESTV